jgi:hypothetical protein
LLLVSETVPFGNCNCFPETRKKKIKNKKKRKEKEKAIRR